MSISIWEDADSCPICGADVPSTVKYAGSLIDAFWADHEHFDAVEIVRDGWRGQYLTPTFVGDVSDLVGADKVPNEVRAAADVWLASMGPASPDVEPSADDVETVLDWTTYHADSILADAGYLADWDDGYIIYKLVKEGETA